MGNGIIYPEKGVNGDNLLRDTDVIIKPRPVVYSLRVDLEMDNKVTVIMPIPVDPENSWSFFRYAGMSVGWKHTSVLAESGTEMHFTAQNPGHADLPAYFIGHNQIEVKFIENGDEKSARTKILKW